MELDWLTVEAVVLLLVAAWFLVPYFQWRRAASQPLEAQVLRTSFQHSPGELVPPAWKAPELTLSVIVPAYNEEYRLPQMLDETLTYLEARASGSPEGFSYEVIVVDDGSIDGTYASALGFCQRRGTSARGFGDLRVIQLAQNRGKGFAVRAGMLAARGQLLLMADADGSTSIRDLERLEHALGRRTEDGHGVQMVFGSRHHLKDQVQSSRSWVWSSVALSIRIAIWLIVGGPVHDTQCGFKLFRADVGKLLFASLHLQRWAFDVELMLLARYLGLRIAEVPVTWVEMPGSKMGLATGALSMLRDTVLVQVLYGLGVWRPSVLA